MKTAIAKKIRRFFRYEKGQSVSEYGSLLAFIAFIVAMAFVFTRGSLGGELLNIFRSLARSLEELAEIATRPK